MDEHQGPHGEGHQEGLVLVGFDVNYVTSDCGEEATTIGSQVYRIGPSAKSKYIFSYKRGEN